MEDIRFSFRPLLVAFGLYLGGFTVPNYVIGRYSNFWSS